MSTFGDNTAKQEILDALQYTTAITVVHPLAFLQMVNEVVAELTYRFACEKGVEVEWGRSVPIRTVIDGQYVDASPYQEGDRKEV